MCGDEWRAVSTRCLTDGWSRQSACPPFGRARHDEAGQGRPEKDTESEPGKGGHRVRQEANTLFGEVPRAPRDLREGEGHDEEGD